MSQERNSGLHEKASSHDTFVPLWPSWHISWHICTTISKIMTQPTFLGQKGFSMQMSLCYEDNIAHVEKQTSLWWFSRPTVPHLQLQTWISNLVYSSAEIRPNFKSGLMRKIYLLHLSLILHQLCRWYGCYVGFSFLTGLFLANIDTFV